MRCLYPVSLDAEVTMIEHSSEPEEVMRNRKGFTLIELLIVVVIIGILAAIAIPKFANTKEKAVLASMKSDLRNLVTAQEAFFSDNQTYAVGDRPDADRHAGCVRAERGQRDPGVSTVTAGRLGGAGDQRRRSRAPSQSAASSSAAARRRTPP